MLTITVIGCPAPQGSKKFVGVSKRTGRGIMVESSKRVKPWRESVKYAALEAVANGQGITGPVSLDITFTLPKPKSAPERSRTWPDKKPDLSKLIRSTEDSLTEAGVFEDDARIVECSCRKAFPGEHPDALHVPGAVIRVSSIAAQPKLEVA